MAYDLKVFFTVVGKDPAAITPRDVLTFLKEQRSPRCGPGVVRSRTAIGVVGRHREAAAEHGVGVVQLLLARGDAGIAGSPVPGGLATRRSNTRGRGVPLLRTPRTLPRVLGPAEVDKFLTGLRTARDRAMVQAMLLGGLRRCEVLGLRLDHIRVGEKRLFIAEGKGGHQRFVPVSTRFFAVLGDYLTAERPETSSDRVFVVMKGQRRGTPLTAAGLDEILRGAGRRSGIPVTCHQLRHTCLTRLREAGMALEAVQAQAGHRSIESTRIYLHLANGWLEEEYRRALTALEIPAAAATS